MFRVQPTETGKHYRLAVIVLLVLSAASLAVTVWVMIDFLREQEIVQELMKRLPADAAASAELLAGELRWQFRLTILVFLNLIVTGFAVVLLWRAYRSSQESLRDLKALAGDVLSSMDLAIITTDRKGTVTSVNRRGIELLNLTRDHVGWPLSELSSELPLEKFRQEVAPDDHSQRARDFETTEGGNPRTFRAFCQPLRNYEDAEIGNVLQLRDVTERVLMDDRMRRMERYMGLGSLAAGLHHEIKNPLAALSLHVQLLEEELEGTASEEIQQMLEVIRTEVARVGGVLEGFRDFASVEQPNFSNVDVAELVRRQVNLVALQADQKQIRVSVQLPPDPLPFILADQVRLEQVLLNLLLNGMDAMPSGGDLNVRIQRMTRDEAEYLQIEVQDTGGGVLESVRNRIFDAYFTTKGSGTGMGLALSDKIVRQHHGSLDFHSTTGGTTFEITLPIES